MQHDHKAGILNLGSWFKNNFWAILLFAVFSILFVLAGVLIHTWRVQRFYCFSTHTGNSVIAQRTGFTWKEFELTEKYHISQSSPTILTGIIASGNAEDEFIIPADQDLSKFGIITKNGYILFEEVHYNCFGQALFSGLMRGGYFCSILNGIYSSPEEATEKWIIFTAYLLNRKQIEPDIIDRLIKSFDSTQPFSFLEELIKDFEKTIEQ